MPAVKPSSALTIRSVEVSRNSDPTAAPGLCPARGDQPVTTLISANRSWRAEIGLHRAHDRDALVRAATGGPLECVVGDVREVAASTDGPPFVNATPIVLDWQHSTARISTSITGLPPVFLFRSNQGACLSSPFLPGRAHGALHPDPDGIADTLRWGHPIDGRTLFQGLTTVAANSTVEISVSGEIATHANPEWMIADLYGLSREELVREQLAAFGTAAERFTAENAFVSLTGGLDSRASLVALMRAGHRMPCVTMAGSPESLDARLAAEYCRAQNIPHHTLLLDERFRARLPALLMRTAELTGGVACLGQTADLYLYESLPQAFSTRISGNLGNQVGRGGFESLGAYQPLAEVFSPEIQQRLAARPRVPWFIPRLAHDYADTLFCQEVHFWSIPNYVVGSSRALQLTPYADRRLLSLSKAAFAHDPELRRPTRKMLRDRDVRHRTFGTPRRHSFQRQFIAQNDPRGRAVPLNWGWRAAGGWSLRGRVYAAASAVDAAMIKIGSQPGVLRPIARWASASLKNRSALADWPALITGCLREVVLDTVASQSVRDARVFEPKSLEAVLKQHFNGSQDQHLTVMRAFELALGISARATRVQQKPAL